MALKSGLAFYVLFLFTYCEAKPENCSEARCKLLPVGEGFASEFRSKASEKGVRLVYLNLKIGNDSYDPLELQDEFLPHRWVWAGKISEPMLTLSYDYDILSLGLLTYQVRSIDVYLQDQPSGCLANLNSTCQNKAVGKVLLNETEHSRYGELPYDTDLDIVCVAVRENTDFFEGNVRYHCCAKNKNEKSSIQCDLVVKNSGWFKAFNGILNILTVVMILYCPAFLLALPDLIFNLKEEYQKYVQRRQVQDNNDGSGEDNQALSDSPRTSEYGRINYDSGTIEALSESDPLERRNDSVQSEINGSGSTVEESQQPAQDQISENAQLLTVEQRVVYLDDASPITCSALFDKCINRFKADLIIFNFKLAFLWYLVIPILCYFELWLNYTTKIIFFEEMSRKQEALLAGPIFSFLSSKESLVLYVIAFLPVILYSRPEDFKLNGECLVCKGNDLLLGQELFQHMEGMLIKTQKFFFWLIKKHRKGITKPIKCCTVLLSSLGDELLPHNHCIRSLHTLSHLLCDAMVISFCGLFLGAVYFFLVLPVGVVLLCLFYSPYFTLAFALYRKAKHLYRTQVPPFLRSKLTDNYAVNCFLYSCVLLFMIVCSFLIMENLTVACLAGALSCRFIVKMFGYIIIGLVLNAEIASPFVTFVIVASTNMYLCYYNLQKKYQEVKEMISQHWQKHKNLLNNTNLSNSDEGTIPEDLFWYICSSKYKVLPIRPEIYRMLRNMVVILIFLVLALCSIIFLGKTYSISSVASTIAVFVTGVIPGLFFKGITKGKKFTGPTKRDMIKEIEKAVNEYIKAKKRNSTGSAIQSQGSNFSGERNENYV